MGQDSRAMRALQEAAIEVCRADEAAGMAVRHEGRAASDGVLAAHHESMARIHRGSEKRHRTTAELYREYARRLLMSGDESDESAVTSIVTSIASLAAAPSTALVLGAGGSHAVGVLASDATARAAEECEYVLGEGPAHDTGREGPLQADSVQISDRWPGYGRAVRDLGVLSVAAVPLRTHRSQVGSIVVLGANQKCSVHYLTRLNAVGEAFVRVLLGDPDHTSTTEFASLILTGVDHRPIVHQAAGIIVEVCGCSTDDALARLRARSFAEGVTLLALAEHVVGGRLDEVLRD